MSTYQTTTAHRPATDRQIAYLRSLLAEKDLTGTAFPSWDGAALAYLTSVDASEAIDMLKGLPRKVTEAPAAGITEDGMYRRASDGAVFKVQFAVHGSGHLYAKHLVVTGTEAHWEFAKGAVRTLRPEDKMTLAQAQEFGQLYGVCCVCGATLTDEESIAAGIGPVCRTRF